MRSYIIGNGEKRMRYPEKEEIIKLVEKVNSSKMLAKKGLYPLEFSDDGWRIVFPKALEFYTFLLAGRKLMEEAVYDTDFQGGYYWIQYTDAPNGVTTPALKLRSL